MLILKVNKVKVKKLIVTDHPVVTTGNASIDIQNIPRWITQWLKESFVDKNSLNKKDFIMHSVLTTDVRVHKLIEHRYPVKQFY